MTWRRANHHDPVMTSHLIRGERKLATNDAPDLDINFRAVKSGFVRHFDEGNL